MILAKIFRVLRPFVVWGIIPQVKSDADFENYICRRISQRLGVFLVGFNANGLVLQKIFILAAWIMLANILGVKKDDYYETMTADWIYRRLGVIPIKSIP